jgi:hypothetical protein
VGSSSLLIGEAQYIKYLIETVGEELMESRFELITSLVPKGGERERENFEHNLAKFCKSSA